MTAKKKPSGLSDQPGDHDVLLLSFSGVDGAGKSTQISALHARLLASGVRVARLAFWDHVATWARFREVASVRLFKGDGGVGSPDRPVQRRDKNIRAWYLTFIRFFLYLLDACRLRLVVSTVIANHADVILFDRYIYDELVNLPLRNRIGRASARLLLKCVPHPDIAYLLDADPSLACERKPEYPLDFVDKHRKAYLDLQNLAHEMKVIAPGSVGEVQQEILRKLVSDVPERKRRHLSGLTLAAEGWRAGGLPSHRPSSLPIQANTSTLHVIEEG